MKWFGGQLDIQNDAVAILKGKSVRFRHNFFEFVATLLSTSICLYLVMAVLLITKPFSYIFSISQFENDYITFFKFFAVFVADSLISAAFIFYLRIRFLQKPVSTPFIFGVVISVFTALILGVVISLWGLTVRGGF